MNLNDHAQQQAMELVKNAIATVDFSHAEIPGWEELFSYPINIVGSENKKHIQISEKDVLELLKKAEFNHRSFDLAVYLAAKQIGFGPARSQALQKFAAGVLDNKVTRPPPKGRRQKVGSLMDICRYIVALQIVDIADINLTRGDETGQLSGCEVAAQAFSENGYPTTRGQIKSICYDSGFSRFRSGANYLVNGEFSDRKAHMDVRNPKNGPQFLRNVPLFFFKT